jgi:hypothetical protein
MSEDDEVEIYAKSDETARDCLKAAQGNIFQAMTLVRERVIGRGER